MTAPTPAPGDDRPREGYYPDPSIPGYVRYWNGAAWVPGTSRPAPTDGAPPPPSGAGPAGPAVEETGPHFFDEDPADGPAPAGPPADLHGGRPADAPAWGADRTRQAGFGGDQDRRVSWGAPESPDPRQPGAGTPDGTAVVPPAASGPAASAEGPGSTGGPAPSESTMAFRSLSPRAGEQGVRPEAPGAAPAQPAVPAQAARGAAPAPHTPAAQAPNAHGAPAPAAQAQARQALGLGSSQPAPPHAATPGTQPPAAPGPAATPAAPQPPTGPGQQSPMGPGQQPATGLPQQSAGPGTPLTSGPGGGQPSWAQQVHLLASAETGGDQPPAPWKPVVEDPFLAAARAQAAARPAGLAKRLAARLLDTLVLTAVTGVAAVPLTGKAIDHINGKIDAARLSGRTVTVWLLDGTTSVYLAIVLAVLVGFGVLYEVLPTVRWGRTLGKKLCGLEVRDIEGHEPPAFGPALRRWLVYSLPGVLGVGVVGVLWCVFDRPWRQCWHDKAAHTFVAG
ncbi:RDD family protein [Streptomyces sp. NPDC052040]|uniref:RDD family protein n=1 Tax=Streptomyces sp. NPDC052040 TaxID=3365682 RepID=UPI0037D74CEE